MLLKSWEDLPIDLRKEEIKPYYNVLYERKGSLLLKRIFDIILAFILLVFLSPILGILCILIKLDSEGPVFFRQIRVTQYGKEFKIYKFRTMVVNAEKIGTQVTIENDSRITKIGKFIRKYRLDEIPQLFNVLNGTMSFVGTRPEVPKYVKEYTPEMYATLLLPAGITSLASIKYKDEAELLSSACDPDRTYIEQVLPGKMEYNLKSIKKFSFRKDVIVMLLTLKAVIKE